MQSRALGVVLLVLGLILVAFAVFADAVFGGPGRHVGFGFQQALALVAGLGLAVTGSLLTRKR